MKKLLLASLLIPTFLMAQNRPDWDYDFRQPISVDFPQKLPVYRNYLPLQNTYYELNTTLNNIRQLVSDNLKMNPKQNASSGPGFKYEIYTNPTHRLPLKAKYNTFMTYGLEVVKSIEINGDFKDVAKLFIYMYDTNYSVNEMPINKATKHYKQDYAVFTVNIDGKASIVISNTQYNDNTANFIKDFNKQKEKFKTDLKLGIVKEEQLSLVDEKLKIERKQDEENYIIAQKEEYKQTMVELKNSEAAKPKIAINVYYFSKSGSKLQFKNQPSAALEKEITEKVSGYKKGSYSAYVTTTSILENKTYDIKINQTQ